MNFHGLSSLMLSVSSLALGVFVYLKGRRRPANVTYALMTFAIALWCFGQFMGEVSQEKGLVLLWTRINLAGGILTLVLYANFVAAFLKRSRELRVFVAAAYLLGGCLLIADTTGSFVKDVRPTLGFRYYPVPGPAYPLLLVLFAFSVSFGLYNLAVAVRDERGSTKAQVLYIFLSSVIGFVGTSTLFLPVFGVKIYPFGYYLVLFYILLGVYAIVKHRLMDITLVIRRGLVYSMMVLFLSLLYVGSIYLFGELFRTLTGLRSFLPVVAVLFIFAALFNPLREKLQVAVDRVFFKSRYDLRKTVMRIGDEAGQIFDLNDLLSRVLSMIVSTLGASTGSIFIKNRNGGFELKQGVNLNLSEPRQIIALAKQVKKGRVVFAEEIEDLDALREISLISGRISVPLFLRQELFGILNLGAKISEDAYFDDDVDLLLMLANSLSIAVENAILHEEMVKKERELFRAEKLASLGTLSAGMAHEIKNPISIIKGMAQTLPDNLEDREFLRKLAEIVPRQLDRINGIVEDLMTFARPKELNRSQVDMNLVVMEVASLVQAECKKRSVELSVNLKDGLPMVEADRELLVQAFVNLMLNGLQSIDGGGELAVASFSDGERVTVEISDTGCGIPKNDIPRIFDPFFTTKERGTGLGLAVTYRIIKEHGGEIEVESVTGKGTKFRVSI